MTSYRAPVDEVIFLLSDVFQIDRYDNLPEFNDAPPDVRLAIINEAASICEEVLHPLNGAGDREGCVRMLSGHVITPRGFKEAFRQVGEGGWIGLTMPQEYGGLGLPLSLGQVVVEFTSSANMSLAMYQELTRGVISVLLAHGSEEQKKKYIPNMIAGRWAGTMDLTEPHAGTDLGMMRTRASRQADGSYKISGTKIFISGGDQDMTENIIHLVLARIDGGPPGIKGVSLFVVPKTIVKDDGSLGESNHVHCGSIEHKMGIRGSATCVLDYSDATGWLVGEEHRGMQAMFVMMNEARLAVGTLGLAQSEIAYQNAATYAKERLQGRSLSGATAPDRPADPIIVHPDVRRTLLSIRAFNESARALTIWAALKGDMAECADTIGERTAADDYLSLLTPIIKGFLSDKGFANTVAAQQIFGGHGYIVETGVEQFVRDSRIAMLYEGANGVQALDLVSRKLPKDGGRVVEQFIREIGEFLEASRGNEDLAPILTSLRESLNHLELATTWLLTSARSQPERAAAASTDYLHLFGLVALGYMWALMANTAQRKIADGAETDYFRGKLVIGAFFAQNSLPETAVLLQRVREGSKVSLEFPMKAF